MGSRGKSQNNEVAKTQQAGRRRRTRGDAAMRRRDAMRSAPELSPAPLSPPAAGGAPLPCGDRKKHNNKKETALGEAVDPRFAIAPGIPCQKADFAVFFFGFLRNNESTTAASARRDTHRRRRPKSHRKRGICESNARTTERRAHCARAARLICCGVISSSSSNPAPAPAAFAVPGGASPFSSASTWSRAAASAANFAGASGSPLHLWNGGSVHRLKDAGGNRCFRMLPLLCIFSNRYAAGNGGVSGG